jgi:hypothetical protein
MRGSEGPISNPLEELWRVLPAVEHWLMLLPEDDRLLWNWLCYALPSISDIDPGFAKLAQAPGTWRTIVLSDREIDEETRLRRLGVVDGYLHHVLNNASLHILGVVANVPFQLIADLLDHHNLVGGYTPLMPHYLFAGLFQKVTVLRALARVAIDADSQAVACATASLTVAERHARKGGLSGPVQWS